jgi:thiol peroxidase
MDLGFGAKYATQMKERRWHRRAVFVVGKDDKVHYVAYMPALGDQPNYEEVIGVAKQLVSA